MRFEFLMALWNVRSLKDSLSTKLRYVMSLKFVIILRGTDFAITTIL